MARNVVIGFGGCQLHGPLNSISKRRLVSTAFEAMGFRQTPFVFTPAAALQLLAYCRGQLEVPPLIRRLCWAGSEYAPDQKAAEIVNEAEIVLMEPNSPVDIVYKGFFLSQQEVKKYIEDVAEAQRPVLGKAVRLWKREGLLEGNENSRLAAAAEILEKFTPRTESDELLLDVVREARGVSADAKGVRDGIAQVRDALKARMGVVLYTMRFTPEGKPTSWPPDFKDNVLAAARDLNLPIYEPAHLIAERGVKIALKDFRHYHTSFKAIAGDALLPFIRKVSNGAGFDDAAQERRSTAVPSVERPVTPTFSHAERQALAHARECLRVGDLETVIAVTEPLLAGITRVPAQQFRAQAFLKLNQLEDAEAAFRELLGTGTDDARVLDNLARIAVRQTMARARESLRQGEFETVLALTEPFLTTPNRAAAQQLRAQAFFKLDQLEEAASAYRELLATGVDEARVLDNLARVSLRMGDSAHAISCWRRAMEIAPNTPGLRFQLGQVLYFDGQTDEALELVVANADPDEPPDERLNGLRDRLLQVRYAESERAGRSEG
jgi:tetratricopeptide (TPR) repeat protein